LKKTVIYILEGNNKVIDLFEELLGWLGPSGFSRYVQYCHSNSSTAHRNAVEQGFLNNTYRVLVVTDTPKVISDVQDIDRMIQFGAGYSAEDATRRMNIAGRDGRQAEAVILIQKGIMVAK
jgi:Lhr-like helicase